jgi:outer membrane murein-binding lipoprotein Lpp
MTNSICTRRQSAFIRWLWISGLALFLTMFHSLSYAGDNSLLNDQILHISCNGDANDQSDLKHPVENKGVTFFSDRLTQSRIACFFGGNDYLKIPNHPAFTMSRFTIAAWVKVEGSYNGTERRAIISNYAGIGDAQHYGINMGNGVAGVFVDDGNALDGARDIDGISLTDDKWHHVAAVFEQGAKTKLYVDGEFRKQSSAIMPASITPSGDLYIGRGGDAEGFEKKWTGSIDEVRLFKRALSDDEVGLMSAIIDLPTGETFIPAGYGENDPYFVTVKEGPVETFKMTPNPDDSLSINNVSSSDTRRVRNGSSIPAPSETSTLILNDGEMMWIDEALPGVVATVNIFGDLIVTDTKYPDLKLILYRNDDQFVFQSQSNPSVNIKVHADGSLDIIDENQPNLKITRDKQSIIKIEDAETNTVTLVDMDGHATLAHPDAPNIEVKFNVFDTPLSYTLTDTTTGDCVEITPDDSDTRRRQLRNGALKDDGDLTDIVIETGTEVAKDLADIGIDKVINTGNPDIDSVLKNGAKKVTGALIDKAVGKVTEVLTGSGSSGGIINTVKKLATGAATSLAAKATSALSGLSAWWTCLPTMSKLAVAGGAIGLVAGGVAIVAALFMKNRELKKKIKALQAQVKALRHQVQVLEATVAQQAEEIRILRETVKDQAEQIVQLKAKIDEQAQKIDEQAQRIAALEDEAEKRKEEMEKQKEMIASMQEKIADLEERVRSGKDGAEEIPPGEAPGTRRALRNGSSDTCRTPIQPAMCQVYGVQDQGPNDSIAFFYNPVEQTVTQIGDTCQGCDLEAMAIHPITNVIYLGSGDNAVGHPNGHLYKFDANSGALRSVGITGFEDISGLTFDDNGVLWGWAKGQGLVILDIDTGRAQIQFASSIELADLSWDSNYQLLYGVVGKELWSYDPNNGNANQLCGNLPRKTEAVKALPSSVLPAGLVWIGSHNNQQTELQVYEIATCQPQKDLNLFVGYDDVEGLAMPTAACQ